MMNRKINPSKTDDAFQHYVHFAWRLENWLRPASIPFQQSQIDPNRIILKKIAAFLRFALYHSLSSIITIIFTLGNGLSFFFLFWRFDWNCYLCGACVWVSMRFVYLGPLDVHIMQLTYVHHITFHSWPKATTKTNMHLSESMPFSSHRPFHLHNQLVSQLRFHKNCIVLCVCLCVDYYGLSFHFDNSYDISVCVVCTYQTFIWYVTYTSIAKPTHIDSE